ncbi:Eco57I restriction-modification methylase domain-containing protein [Curvibacter gracilis]|uniref:Eco57I restriction-modification methylase domain-containing protein n=1 Tax=Curvibacter gracilis TaxID=230310 RepID=UPI000483DB27|nr:type IIL restriction-modification enzyme MmeI [Curvibacter gracilis]
MSMHHEWLSLIEISGPFLAVPVLKEVFPQGLEELDAAKRKRLRQAYDEWHEAKETDDSRFVDLHAAWIDEVLSCGLELDEDGRGDVLKGKDWCSTHSNVSLPEHGVSLSPDFAVVGNDDKPLMLVHAYGSDVDLDATSKLDGWASTPAERMVTLCRAKGCRLGLVTNGERWMLVDAPLGAVTTFASWYARIWGQEPVTLQAFVHLLGIRRFFVDESERLPALFDRSLKFQDEVTDALGEQVRRAVEVLIQALDKADQDRDRELLRGVEEAELYEAALTVMMRLVFLLSAEERGLLLLGDERYEANYAVASLRIRLRAESDDILERRWDAWSRLLAVFRAVYGGIEHENLRLPALGGSLFDPDRFPFLEGRAKGSAWRTDVAKPLPIDNRTVLLLLEAIQQFQGRTLSYRALDVEQIGYVYEGLLERTVQRTPELTLELDGTKNAQSPWVTLAELESARLDGAERLAELLQQRSGSSASRVRNDLARPVDDALADRLLTACHGDTALRDRIKPFGHLVRTDPWGYPLVYPARAFIVTTGSDRRETGTHYTPKSLTEAIVAETLTPIAYVGPAQGTPRADWALKSPAELLDLKICDPAMGSGAFLVQACRWLADRLVEAWAQAEAMSRTVSADGRVVDADASNEPLPHDTEARTIVARRLIAERCLYGVDLNPLAVELAKLSIWLVTLAKGRPFGFLDHNLRCGDSLLGIYRLDQLTQLSMNPTSQGQLRLFGQNIERAVHEAIKLRQRLREMPVRDIRDVEVMAHLDADARRRIEVSEQIADAFIGEVFLTGGSGSTYENALATLSIQAGQVIDGDHDTLALMRKRSVKALSTDVPAAKPVRRPLHWPLEFPEVFTASGVNPTGFDAIVGNPPFLGGKRITSIYGEKYTFAIKKTVSEKKGAADLSAYFLLRAFSVIRGSGILGLVVTNSINEGDNREVGLASICEKGGVVFGAETNRPWPGSAGVTVSTIFIIKGGWAAQRKLNGSHVILISEYLTDHDAGGEPYKLESNKGLASTGTGVNGKGFILSVDERNEFVLADSRNQGVIQPYLTSQDINQRPDSSPSRFIINFGNMAEDAAKLFELPYARVAELVKPVRDKLTRQIHETCFWKHWDRRDELYAALSGLKRALVLGRVSSFHAVSFMETGCLPFDGVVVFLWEDFGHFGLLQSSVHEIWCDRFRTTLREDLRYSVSDCFSTFARPHAEQVSVYVEEAGRRYFEFRAKLMLDKGEGLTKTYSRFHQPAEMQADIVELRRRHVELNAAVLAAYGWSDILPQYDFHSTVHGLQFSVAESARREILKRLLRLNHERHAEEVAQGLHTGTSLRMSSRASRTGRTTIAAITQPSLDFEAAIATAANGDTPVAAILSILSARDGLFAKADILAATGITDGQWNTAIAELISSGRVERQGERRGARYRFIGGGD